LRRRLDWIDAIHDVQREYFAMELGSEYLRNAVKEDPKILWRDPRAEWVDKARDNLQETYLVRLYAVFENGLRNSWINSIRETEPPMRQLVDAVSSHRKIPYHLSENAHSVRIFQNAIVHEDSEESEVIDIRDARSHLCTFFARLSSDW
jgi:hypothetical protein